MHGQRDAAGTLIQKEPAIHWHMLHGLESAPETSQQAHRRRGAHASPWFSLFPCRPGERYLLCRGGARGSFVFSVVPCSNASCASRRSVLERRFSGWCFHHLSRSRLRCPSFLFQLDERTRRASAPRVPYGIPAGGAGVNDWRTRDPAQLRSPDCSFEASAHEVSTRRKPLEKRLNDEAIPFGAARAKHDFHLSSASGAKRTSNQANGGSLPSRRQRGMWLSSSFS